MFKVVKPSKEAKKVAEIEKIKINSYNIIYELLDFVKQRMSGLLTPNVEEKVIGSAEILEIFKVLKSWKSRGLQSGNSNIIRKTILLRQKLALLLGYQSFSHYRLETEMAKGPENVQNFLQSIWDPARRKVKKDTIELNKLFKSDGYSGKLKPWDWR